MSFEFKIARRYFLARRGSMARLTAVCAVVGIAAGVAALILANALAQGFADEMRDKILTNTAHVAVFAREETAEIADWQAVKTAIESIENVRSVAPTAFENALLVGANESSYAILKVRDAADGGDLRGANVAVGWRLAEKLHLKIGDAAEIATIENQAPARVRVAEILQTGLYDYDAAWIQVAPENFARLNNRQTFAPTVLNVSVEDVYQSGATANRLRDEFGDRFVIVDWQEANRPLFAALDLERRVALAIIALIVFVAALNITTTLALLVSERRHDIAVLRACGARAASLMRIFLLEGLLTACAGISAGVIVGLLACWSGNHFRLVRLPAEVYALDHIRFAPTVQSAASIAAAVFVLCLAATVYPAWKASRVKPSENLRRR